MVDQKDEPKFLKVFMDAQNVLLNGKLNKLGVNNEYSSIAFKSTLKKTQEAIDELISVGYVVQWCYNSSLQTPELIQNLQESIQQHYPKLKNGIDIFLYKPTEHHICFWIDKNPCLQRAPRFKGWMMMHTGQWEKIIPTLLAVK